MSRLAITKSQHNCAGDVKRKRKWPSLDELKAIRDEGRLRGIRDMIRRKKSVPYRVCEAPAKFRRLIDKYFMPGLEVIMKNAHRKKIGERKETLYEAAFNVAHAGLDDKTVGDSRERINIPQIRIDAMDDLENAGLVYVAPGTEYFGRTRYFATEKLLNCRRAWKKEHLRLDAVPELPIVFIKDKDGNRLDPKMTLVDFVDDLTLANSKQNKKAFVELWVLLGISERIVIKMNELNNQNLFIVDVVRTGINVKVHTKAPVDPTLTWLHSGGAYKHARLYALGARGTSMPREQRETMIIATEKSIELDFSALHARILYNLCGLAGPEGDLYQPDKIFRRTYRGLDKNGRRGVRDFVKICFMILANTKSRKRARTALCGELKRDKTLQRLTREEFKSRAIDDVAEALLKRMEEVHRPIAHKFYKLSCEWLMTLDGLLMLSILDKLQGFEIPAFPIHDALRVRKSDAPAVLDIMQHVYHAMFGFHPVIKTK